MKQVLILIISIITLIGCSSSGEINSDLKIRLSNISDFNFQNIIVNTSTGNVNFENINSGQVTGYKTFQIAYRYAFIEMEIILIK